ncbi:hypothetical protein D3C77_503880 [compost metagenome]
MVAVVQAGNRVLRADLAQLLQFGAVVFGADHDLDARLAIVGGRREVHASLETIAIDTHATAGQFAVAFHRLVVLQEGLETALIAGFDQVDHRHAFQIFDVGVAEQLKVGAVGIDVHAVVHVGNGVHRAVEQQLAAFFRLAQGDLGGAACASFRQVGQLAVGDQDQALVFAAG